MGIYKCIMCGKSYGPLVADPFGMAKGIKTRDGSYACSDRCARDWNHHVLNSGGSSGSSSPGANQSSSNQSSGGFGKWIAEEMKSDEEKLAEQGLSGEEIARIQEAKAKADLEAAKFHAEQEEKEAAKRHLKAEKYKQEGRPFFAWLIGMHPASSILYIGMPLLICLSGQDWLIIIGGLMTIINICLIIKDAAKLSMKVFGISIVLIIGSLIGFIMYVHRDTSGDYDKLISESAEKNKKIITEGTQINLKLENIEDRIKLSIGDGNRDKALELANQLVHPMHEIWDNQANGNPYFDEWWSKKREAYKSQIMAMSANKPVQNVDQTAQQEKTLEQTSTQTKQPDYSLALGEWRGTFGNDQLALTIESIGADGITSGFNTVKGNRRQLKGTATKNGDVYNFELKEPGDDKWDGVFKFSITGNIAKGTWAANNGKASKDFSLTK